MPQTPYQALVDKLFPPRFQLHIPTAFKAAYLAVDEAMKTVTFLEAIPTGHQLRGHLVGAAVDYQMTLLRKEGRLPDGITFPQNSARTAHHLELVTKDCLITISQVTHRKEFPRHAGFRENLRVNNQHVLPLPEFQPEPESAGKPHLVITHGYGPLLFIRLGLPHSSTREWLYQKDLLTKKQPVGEPPAPITDAAYGKLRKAVLDAKDRWIDEDATGKR